MSVKSALVQHVFWGLLAGFITSIPWFDNEDKSYLIYALTASLGIMLLNVLIIELVNLIGRIPTGISMDRYKWIWVIPCIYISAYLLGFI